MSHRPRTGAPSSPRALSGVSPAIADAMRAFEDQAVDAVLTDHGLSATDRNDVLSYARDDAAAQMWALMFEAVQTPQPGRTARQQAIADWFSQFLTNQRQPGPRHAALEYAKFMGRTALQQQHLQTAHRGWRQRGPDQGLPHRHPEPIRHHRHRRATGGFCRYHPPCPYASEYDGHTHQSCFVPCSEPLRLSSGPRRPTTSS